MNDLKITGIDPGPVRSGYITVKIWPKLRVEDAMILNYDLRDTKYILDRVVGEYGESDIIVVEGIACYGKIYGNDIINTGYVIGQFKDRWNVITGLHDKFGIFTTPEVRASIMGTARAKATELRKKVREMWAPILPEELNKDKHRHVVSALSIVTHYIIKNIGIQFFR